MDDNLPKVAKLYIHKEWKPCIIYRKGTKFTKAAINTGSGIKTVKLKNRDVDQATEMDYSLDKAIRLFKKYAERGNMSKEIRSLLSGKEQGS